MSNENQVEVGFGGDASGAVEAAGEAQGAVERLTATIKGVAGTLLEVAGAAKGSFREISVGAREAAESVKGASETIKEMREAISGIGEALIAAFAIEQLSEFARKMGEVAEAALHTAQTFGLTVGEVQKMQGLAATVGAPADVMNMAMQRLDRSFATAKQGAVQQSAAFEKLGIDTQGAYTQSELLQKALEGLSKMDAGPAKVAVAMQLFGRNIQELAPILNMTEEQIKEANTAIEEYGVVNETAAAKGVVLAESFNQNKLASMGLNNVLTDAFAPILATVVDGVNDLAKAFIESYNTGGAAKGLLDLLGGALKFIEEVCADLVLLIVVPWHLLQGAVDICVDAVEGVIKALGQIMPAAAPLPSFLIPVVNAFKGAWDAVAGAIKVVVDWVIHTAQVVGDFLSKIPVIGSTFQKIGQDLHATFGAVANDFHNWGAAIDKIWDPNRKAPLPKASTGTTADDPSKKPPKAKKEHDPDERIQDWEAELQDKKLAANDFWNDDLRGEQQFWEGKLAILLNEGPKLGQTEKAFDAEVRTIRNKLYQDSKTLADQERTENLDRLTKGTQDLVSAEDTKFKVTMDGLRARADAVKQEARRGELDPLQALALLEQVNAEEVAAERAKADAIYQIDMDAIHGKEALYAQDPVNLAKAQAEEIRLSHQHQDALTQIEAKGVQDRLKLEQDAATQNEALWRQRVGPIVQSFGQQMAGLINGTQTFRGAVNAVFLSVENTAISAVGKIVTNWIAGELAKTAASQGQSVLRQGIQLVESLFGIGQSKVQAVAQVGANAAVAGSAGVASAAAIPITGWAMAPAAGATDAAAAMSFGALASAAGGYDIPSGVNPLVQTHEQEMILPAKLANPLRTMLTQSPTLGGGGGGGGFGADPGGGGDTHHWHISTMDARSFQRVLEANPDVLQKPLERHARNLRMKAA